MSCLPEYCVAIRTLGKAGDLFVDLIKSLKNQTHLPKAIFVYIAEGFRQPDSVADEIYITCQKGMVRQRAQQYDEIDTEFILFCDDDVYLPPDSVQKLFEALSEHHADCIAPKVFLQHKGSLSQKIIQGCFALALPSFFAKYAVRIRMSSHFSYALRPMNVMPTQSFAGPCFLAKKSVFLSVHMDEECWMDQFRYPLGEDQMLAFKMFLSGYSLLMHFGSGIIHRNAKTSHIKKDNDYYHGMSSIRYILWYRSIYQTRASLPAKYLSVVAFYSSWLWLSIMSVLLWIARKEPLHMKASLAGLKAARRYVDSEGFRQLPVWEKGM